MTRTSTKRTARPVEKIKAGLNEAIRNRLRERRNLARYNHGPGIVPEDKMGPTVGRLSGAKKPKPYKPTPDERMVLRWLAVHIALARKWSDANAKAGDFLGAHTQSLSANIFEIASNAIQAGRHREKPVR